MTSMFSKGAKWVPKPTDKVQAALEERQATTQKCKNDVDKPGNASVQTSQGSVHSLSSDESTPEAHINGPTTKRAWIPQPNDHASTEALDSNASVEPVAPGNEATPEDELSLYSSAESG